MNFTPDQLRGHADAATSMGMVSVAAMLRQAADDTEDAERWREFNRSGWPVCFLGVLYPTTEELNAAIDTARKESNHE